VHRLTLRAVTYLPVDRQCDAFLGQCWLVGAELMKATLTLLAPQTSAHVNLTLRPDDATTPMTLILHSALCNMVQVKAVYVGMFGKQFFWKATPGEL